GADPSEFAIDIGEFHRRNAERQASLPASLTTLSTHDTKRGEDVRARLDVIAARPEAWAALLRTLRHAFPLGDTTLDQVLWQAMIGAWPVSRERMHAYAVKAAREAGRSTSWTSPSVAFEERMHAMID